MEDKIINNLFELWKHIGSSGQFLYAIEGYQSVNPDNFSWPSKVFEIDVKQANLKELYLKIELGQLPNSISILENTVIEDKLLKQNFRLQSIVKGMYLDLLEERKPKNDFANIETVNNEKKGIDFAKIASESFSYEVLPSTIIPLLKSTPKLKLFIGKHDNEYVNCGMLFLDKNGCSGLHMIGTIPKFRGLGLGKVMSNKLLFEAFENSSKEAVLVASESGERIYSKLGFIAQGNLKSYSNRQYI